MPKLTSEGPRARTTTVWGVDPPMTKPPIITSLPESTCPRVERLAREEGVAVVPVPPFTVCVIGPATLVAYVASPEQTALIALAPAGREFVVPVALPLATGA